jgi:four helix bundle protein
MNNIAEGHGRTSTKEFIRFLDIAQSSSMEVKSISYVLEDLSYISADQTNTIRAKSDQTAKMIRGLMRYLRTYNSQASPL